MDMPVLAGGMLDLHRHIDDKVCVNLHLHKYWDPEFPSTISLYSEIVFFFFFCFLNFFLKILL